VAAATPASAQTPSDLIISEYVEGSSTNKALELYNPTGAALDLSGYALRVYFNGNTTFTNFPLSGSVPAGGTFVFADNLLASYAQQTTSAGLWNGDDTIVLVHGTDVVDSFGQIGTDPGTAWGTGLTSTVDHTLRRKSSVVVGDTNPNDAFDPALEWDGYPQNTFDGLGSHTVDGGEGGAGGEGEAGAGGAAGEGEAGAGEGGAAGEGEAGEGGAAGEGAAGGESEPVDPCAAASVSIGSVQGSGDASPVVGQTVTVKGVVVGDFQTGGFNGYYLQDSGDGDAATSDGIFIYAPNGTAVATGDLVQVTGRVSEYFTLTEITAASVAVCATAQELPAPTVLSLPDDSATFEAHEGTLVTFTQPLVISEYYNFGRYGEIVLSSQRQYQPTALFAPGSAEATALAAANAADRVTLDDGRSSENPNPAIHPNGQEFTLSNLFRGGDVVSNLTGVLDYRFDLWRVQPTAAATFTSENPRPELPNVGGSLRVSSFNVLNYFTTFNSRGANNAQEFQRQEAKIVAAITRINADVFGLLEIENNSSGALNTLVTALNTAAGATTYAAVVTGTLGTDEITPAILYKPAKVKLAGDFVALTSAIDADFDTSKNRPALAQTFEDIKTGAKFTVVVNHLKSKGSDCNDVGDLLDPNGQGECNGVRTRAAKALARWLATDPTGQGTAGRELLIGDFNAYDHEDPVVALVAAGFTDLEKKYHGEEAYSYVFDGQLGYLDYAFAGQGILNQVTAAEAWHINSDEPSLIDYDTTYKAAAQDAIFAPDAFRSSDHDPVLIGLNFLPPEWNSRLVYLEGDKVSYNGSLWVASWWTQNQQPGNPYGPWQESATAEDGTALWTASRIFVQGDVAQYQGKKYVAQWWTRNEVPTKSNQWGPWKLQ
jgi:predicted extracellular nuclease